METAKSHDIRLPELPLTHAVDIQARFTDYDAFGHINNNAYMQYFDLGKSLFFTDSLGMAFSPAAVGAVIVNVNVNFYSATTPGTPLRVLTGCTRLGNRSLTLHQQAVNAATGQVKADAISILAGFDIDTQSSAPLPDSLRAALEKLMHG